MTPNLDELTTLSDSDLTRLEKAIAKERKDREQRKRQQAAQELKDVARKHNLPLEEIVEAARKRGTASQPRFQHPSDPKKTWTGHGRKPKWVNLHLEQGGSLDDLRIPD